MLFKTSEMISSVMVGRGKGGWRSRFDHHKNDKRNIEKEDRVKRGQFGYSLKKNLVGNQLVIGFFHRKD